jgi:cytochrome c556
VLCAIGAGLLVFSSSLSPAHEGATGVVKQRMDDMKKIGRALKRTGERLKSKRGLGEIAKDAEEMRVTAERMPSLFPPGSGGGHSEAKAAVWDRWPDFVAAARLFEQEADKLAAAARSGSDPAIAAQFQAVTRACSACHETFKSKP